jgi:hypothetical protein
VDKQVQEVVKEDYLDLEETEVLEVAEIDHTYTQKYLDEDKKRF